MGYCNCSDENCTINEKSEDENDDTSDITNWYH